jgi:phage/plasmid-associated DNA primase
VPFLITIPEKEQDRELGERLKAEYPGILHACIQGCLSWQEKGLAPPKAVSEATDAYLRAQDSFTAWIDEECDKAPNAWTRSTELFASWRQWAEQNGVPYGDTKQFRDRFEAQGFEHKPDGKTRRAGYQGIKLKPTETDFSNTYWNK